APCLPKDGARLIAEASARGGAEAAAVLAVLYAVGASPRHTVEDALASLTAAAERGWAQARAQLTALAGTPSLAAGPEGSKEPESPLDLQDPGVWPRLARSIDLAAWRKPQAATDLSATPLIRCYPEFASPAVCRWAIERAGGRLSRALVYEALSKEVTVRPTRTNTAAPFNLLETDVVLVLLQLKMAACLELPLRQFEAMTVLHYDEGEEITDHYDFVDPNIPGYAQELAQRGDRIVTFLVYLNEDYGGGETAFPRLQIEHKGRRGEGLYFVNASEGGADVRTLHAGRSPRAGEKWIVSQFVRNRAIL
ncbi:MAG TPA: 2OG-Fe(II) oxygenase, partial [Gammaproteobacteria bacterium]|nr:2OG-Fe(II) oxygenase [Gammaproteobacteria bacterium]